jgi:hypothetical protein
MRSAAPRLEAATQSERERLLSADPYGDEDPARRLARATLPDAANAAAPPGAGESDDANDLAPTAAVARIWGVGAYASLWASILINPSGYILGAR